MKKIFYLLYIITTSFFMACEKEEHLVNKNNEQLPQNPKDAVQNKFILQCFISSITISFYHPHILDFST